ncbi:MAG: Sec-independent protein translocase protein TatB [Pseudomonadota bacterium]|nr:Sec-independent protein translocase protein TatB [Pseudomonadota bacterium]
MLDIGWPELFLIGVVILLVVGPKDLPGVLRRVGIWVRKAKVITGEFRGHVDNMVRESELSDVKDQITSEANINFSDVTDLKAETENSLEDALDYTDIDSIDNDLDEGPVAEEQLNHEDINGIEDEPDAEQQIDDNGAKSASH